MKKLILLIVFLTTTLMAQTPASGYTTNLSLKKYPLGARGIADSLNWNMDRIDTYWKINKDSITALRSSFSSYMPKSGGTFTGAVNMGTNYFYLPTMTPALQGGIARTGTGLVTFGYGIGTVDTLVSRRYLRTTNQTINGNTTFNGLVTLTNDFYTASSFDVDGNATFGGNVTFSGTVTGINASGVRIVFNQSTSIVDTNTVASTIAPFYVEGTTTDPYSYDVANFTFVKLANDDSLVVQFDGIRTNPDLVSITTSQLAIKIDGSFVGATVQIDNEAGYESLKVAYSLASVTNGVHLGTLTMGLQLDSSSPEGVLITARRVVAYIK